jgi:hypothetical protein
MLALLKIFDMIPNWVLALLLAAALAGGCVERTQHKNTKLQLSELKVQVAQVEAAREKATRAAEEANRKVEALRNSRAQEIDHVVREEKRAAGSAVRDGAATRSLLVSATAAVTAPSGGSPTVDPKALARAEQTAAALGQLLGTCDLVAQDLGRDVEDLAAQVRGLLARYESLSLSDPLLDGGEVHPRIPTLRYAVVDSPLPVALTQPLLNSYAGLDWE